MKTNENNTTTAIAAQSTKSTVLLAIDKIRPNPNNPRRSYDENALAELAASIATHGLIQPIRVRAAAQGCYIIVCGERRYRAVQLLGQTEIEAIVDAAPADERAIFDLALSENIQREEMPPLDEAEAYKAAMQTLGGDAAAVAARFGKSEQYIYYRMKLNELIPDVKKLLRENSITLGLAMELARYGKDLQKTICKDRLKDEEGWRKYSVKEFKRMVDAHYTNDLARYRFDQTACAACKHNTNLYDMFATGSGRCTNRECLEAKNREFIERKSGELLAQNPKFILCKDRYGCNDHDKAVEHMTENGVECKAFEYGQVQEMPAIPAEPCPADYATDADYTAAMQIYEQQKKAAEEKTADLLAKHDAGAIRIFVKTSRDDARLVYVNQAAKGRESTGELIARLEEKKIRNTELAHEKTVEAVRPADRPRRGDRPDAVYPAGRQHSLLHHARKPAARTPRRRGIPRSVLFDIRTENRCRQCADRRTTRPHHPRFSCKKPYIRHRFRQNGEATADGICSLAPQREMRGCESAVRRGIHETQRPSRRAYCRGRSAGESQDQSRQERGQNG